MPKIDATPQSKGSIPVQFGILFTSHPNADAEPYPHRDVHKRV